MRWVKTLKICKNLSINCCKPGFFHISPRIGTVGDFVDNISNLHKFAKNLVYIFFLYFSTKWHIWCHLSPFCKLPKIFKNLVINCCSRIFSYFFANWLILRLLRLFCEFSKNCKNFDINCYKIGFFCISPRIGTFDNVWDHCASLKNLQKFGLTNWYTWRYFRPFCKIWEFWNIFKKFSKFFQFFFVSVKFFFCATIFTVHPLIFFSFIFRVFSISIESTIDYNLLKIG